MFDFSELVLFRHHVAGEEVFNSAEPKTSSVHRIQLRRKRPALLPRFRNATFKKANDDGNFKKVIIMLMTDRANLTEICYNIIW
jgi:hypothetical protein